MGVIIDMTRIVVRFVSLFLCIVLTGCASSHNKKNIMDKNENAENEVESKNSDKICTAIGVPGKVEIVSLEIELRSLRLQIKNLTVDNTLVSAYFEYTRIKNNGELLRVPLYCDKINLPAGETSEEILFEPQKYFDSQGEVRIICLVFSDDKDDYAETEDLYGREPYH